MSEITFIYALKEPCSGIVRYIGKSDNVSNRVRAHLEEAKNSKKHSHRLHWLRGLISKEKVPQIEILEEVKKTEWSEREIYWIKWFRDIGCLLVNSTNGGEGNSGLKHSPEALERIRSAQVGNKIWVGRKHSLESKQKMSLARIGNTNCVGRIVSEETRRRISETKKRQRLEREAMC